MSAFLAAGLILVPVFGPFIAPFGVVPVLRFIASGQHGIMAWGWIAMVIAATIRIFPGSIGETAAQILPVYLLVVVLPSLTVEWWQKYGWSEGRWAALATLACVSVCLVMTAVYGDVAGPVATMANEFRIYFSQPLSEGYHSAGMSTAQIDQTMWFLERITGWIFPSLMVIYLLIVLFWVRPRLQLLGVKVETGTFEEYRSEEWLPVAFAATGIATLLLTGAARWVALNLLVTVLMLYFVHGLAIIRAHLARWIGRGWFVRWGVALLCLPMPLPVLVSTLGIADSFYQLRPQTSETGGNHEGHS
jgi:hypothetical protein